MFQKRLTLGDVPYLPPGKGGTDSELSEWFEGHYQRVHDYFTAKAPDQLLEIQLESDDHDKLAAFQDFLHCQDNFRVPHGNHNEAKAMTTFKDRHKRKISEKDAAIKYKHFKVEFELNDVGDAIQDEYGKYRFERHLFGIAMVVEPKYVIIC